MSLSDADKVAWIENAIESLAEVQNGQSAYLRFKLNQRLKKEAPILNPETLTVKGLLWIIRDVRQKG